ncbi:family 20 glycosylhydrolase [Porphyromonas pogonae]|uniref:glycoside hydrolase family 20 protein n=1 Tax=Porphyromonas pogonae TaxID=867595 RepID=UPI002E7A52BC|nr:family 20 glycosylhydrolase [Porphyromonas pogonae]
MKKINLLIIGLLCACMLMTAQVPTKNQIAPALIPLPAEMSLGRGYFQLSSNTSITLAANSQEDKQLVELLNSALKERCGAKLKTSKSGNIKLVITSRKTDNPEGYNLNITPQSIELSSSTRDGLFYGIQTILQLTDNKGRIKAMTIKDEPRFKYRGLHLDVSRHFMSKEFIKKLLDEMAYYKLNTFHWHLVDGGGWRMESKKYPLLTQKAAFRTIEDWDEWWGHDRRFVDEGTPGSYGGYYTQEDIKEIVAYAKKKHITIIPEIEMPGHSNEVFAAYPELNCLGKWDYETSDFCAGNEKVFKFLEDILDETMELFPSRYIHIGGDEADKKNWSSCPKCQARIKQEGLKNKEELQSYFIKRIEKYLISKGRKLIGWDEILEGGLAPEATVMSWRGEKGGIEAARQGHDVVMTPGGYVYFDFYQSDPLSEPKAIGGYTTLERVYSYNPEPTDLTPEQHRHILGAQANVWTEYIPNEKHCAYMIFPRLLALAEVVWTPQNKRQFDNFLPRVNIHNEQLQERGINTYPLKNIDLSMEVDTVAKEIRVKAKTEKIPAELRYTTDGTMPTKNSALYHDKIVVKDSASIVASLFENGNPIFKPIHYRVDYHKAIGCPVTYNSKFDKGYPAGGATALTDGYRGGPTYLDGRWQGFTETMDVVIDLKKEQPLHRIFAKFMQVKGAWVYMPETVEVLLSSDGKNFTSLGTVKTTVPIDEMKLSFEVFSFNTTMKARYVKLIAKQSKIKNYFLFVDEIVVQ